MTDNIIKGFAYVVGDNIDTDMIIPARHLNDPSPEYLGKHAMEDLDKERHPIPFLNAAEHSDYKIIIAGSNFGCGSSREHAPIALAAAGVEAVVAPSFARIYYRNSVNGGIILPIESTMDLGDYIKTGDRIEIDIAGKSVIRHIPGEERGLWPVRDFGPVKDIIGAGGLTAYNRKRLKLD